MGWNAESLANGLRGQSSRPLWLVVILSTAGLSLVKLGVNWRLIGRSWRQVVCDSPKPYFQYNQPPRMKGRPVPVDSGVTLSRETVFALPPTTNKGNVAELSNVSRIVCLQCRSLMNTISIYHAFHLPPTTNKGNVAELSNVSRIVCLQCRSLMNTISIYHAFHLPPTTNKGNVAELSNVSRIVCLQCRSLMNTISIYHAFHLPPTTNKGNVAELSNVSRIVCLQCRSLMNTISIYHAFHLPPTTNKGNVAELSNVSRIHVGYVLTPGLVTDRSVTGLCDDGGRDPSIKLITWWNVVQPVLYVIEHPSISPGYGLRQLFYHAFHLPPTTNKGNVAELSNVSRIVCLQCRSLMNTISIYHAFHLPPTTNKGNVAELSNVSRIVCLQCRSLMNTISIYHAFHLPPTTNKGNVAELSNVSRIVCLQCRSLMNTISIYHAFHLPPTTNKGNVAELSNVSRIHVGYVLTPGLGTDRSVTGLCDDGGRDPSIKLITWWNVVQPVLYVIEHPSISPGYGLRQLL
ncbi:hypothetical protein J6590_050793 [Homalodisca vitripennis]|nr:hypothetical protein J6590_050793 [Homalodisca vitripennis]